MATWVCPKTLALQKGWFWYWNRPNCVNVKYLLEWRRRDQLPATDTVNIDAVVATLIDFRCTSILRQTKLLQFLDPTQNAEYEMLNTKWLDLKYGSLWLFCNKRQCLLEDYQRQARRVVSHHIFSLSLKELNGVSAHRHCDIIDVGVQGACGQWKWMWDDMGPHTFCR